MYVLSRLRSMKMLDDAKVTPEEREQANKIYDDEVMNKITPFADPKQTREELLEKERKRKEERLRKKKRVRLYL